jgi:hypothetical protein
LIWLRGPDCNIPAELSALQLQETRKQTEGNENENESKSVEQKVTFTVLRFKLLLKLGKSKLEKVIP